MNELRDCVVDCELGSLPTSTHCVMVVIGIQLVSFDGGKVLLPSNMDLCGCCYLLRIGAHDSAGSLLAAYLVQLCLHNLRRVGDVANPCSQGSLKGGNALHCASSVGVKAQVLKACSNHLCDDCLRVMRESHFVGNRSVARAGTLHEL